MTPRVSYMQTRLQGRVRLEWTFDDANRGDAGLGIPVERAPARAISPFFAGAAAYLLAACQLNCSLHHGAQVTFRCKPARATVDSMLVEHFLRRGDGGMYKFSVIAQSDLGTSFSEVAFAVG